MLYAEDGRQGAVRTRHGRVMSDSSYYHHRQVKIKLSSLLFVMSGKWVWKWNLNVRKWNNVSESQEKVKSRAKNKSKAVKKMCEVKQNLVCIIYECVGEGKNNVKSLLNMLCIKEHVTALILFFMWTEWRGAANVKSSWVRRGWRWSGKISRKWTMNNPLHSRI